jgi:F0F1-type ATP synthase membrane subunit a
MAGHTLLHILSSFVQLLYRGYIAFSIFPFILVGCFRVELGIAFLQAYVFTILLCIYS